MDQVQEHELRTWADALCASAESERRAMGKAILMLLGEIETFKRTLEPSQPAMLGVVETVPDQLPDTFTSDDDDTATINLGERLRAATHRRRE